MLLVYDYGCQFHSGEKSWCTCRIFRWNASESVPRSPRVHRLPQRDGESENAARDRYRGIDRELEDKLQGIEDEPGTIAQKYWLKRELIE